MVKNDLTEKIKNRWVAALARFPRYAGWKTSGAMPDFSEVESSNSRSTMEPTFEKLMVRLARAEVEFLLVGGIAVTLNG